MVGVPSYTFPKDTRHAQWSPTMYNPIVWRSLAQGLSLDWIVVALAQLPLVLTRAPNNCISASTGGDYHDALWDNSTMMASLNSLIFSKLFLFSSSTSLLNSSFKSLIMSRNCCGLINAEELLEAHDACPKYWLMVTPVPVAQTRPGCSGRPMEIFNRSWQPWGTKVPCVFYSCKESCNKHDMDITHEVRSFLLYKKKTKPFKLSIIMNSLFC